MHQAAEDVLEDPAKTAAGANVSGLLDLVAENNPLESELHDLQPMAFKASLHDLPKRAAWARTLAALNEPSKPDRADVLVPPKPPIPSGKRSTPGWKGKSVLLKEDTVQLALTD
jgi:hypothetical protein